MVRTVRDADGVTWRVRRRWIPHRGGIGWTARIQDVRRRSRRRRRHDSDAMEAAEVGAEAVFHGLDEAFVAVAVLALVLALAFGWPLVILLIDAAWLVGALVLGVAARVLFRRPWRIEAVNDEGGRAEWHVVGFRAAGEKRDEVATSLRKPTGHVTARPHTAWGGGAGAEALPEPPPLIDPAWPVDRL